MDTEAQPLPRIYLSNLPELDWLTGVEFGRVDDGQPSDCWVGLTDNIGVLLDEPGGRPVGFKLLAASEFDEEAKGAEEVWNGPRFHAPQVGLEDASIGEIVIAARTFFDGQESTNRMFFSAGTSSEGEKALFNWRCCLEAGDSMAHFALGYTLYELGRYHEAYRHLRYYAIISPAGSWNWCWLGKAAEAIGELGEARAAWERACELEVAGGEETDAAELLVQLDLQEEREAAELPEPAPSGDENPEQTEVRFFPTYPVPGEKKEPKPRAAEATGHARLTLTDEDATMMVKYYQCCGSWCSPGETGWVQSIEKKGEPPIINPVDVADVLEDLNAMVPDDDVRAGMIFVLRTGTEEMVQALENGEVAEQRHEGEPTAERRLEHLRGELAGLPL